MSETELVLVIDDLDNLPEVEEKTEVRLPGSVTLKPGDQAFLYPDGVIRNQRGSWVVKPPPEHGSAPAFTPDSAREAVRERERMKEKAVEAAIAKHGKGDVRRGLEKLVGVQVKIASDKEQGFNSTRALERLLQWGGYAAQKGQQLIGAGNGHGIAIGLSQEEKETLSAILDIARRKLLAQRSEAGIATDNSGKRKLSGGDESEGISDG